MGTLLIFILLFTFVGFTISYFIFKKWKPSLSPFSQFMYWFLAPILSLLLLIIGMWAYLYLSSRYEDKTFDSAAWNEDHHKRYEYVDDLVQQQILIGMDSSSILTFLGEPESAENGSLTYYLGYDPKIYFNSDPDWLIIDLESGKAVRTRIEY